MNLHKILTITATFYAVERNREESLHSVAWALFFILCGLANIYIAFWLPQNIWVNFKVFGLTALTLVFTLLSGIYIYRHMPQDDHH